MTLPQVPLPPHARRMDGWAGWPAFPAGTLGPVRDDARCDDEQRRIELSDADRHNADVVHSPKSRWTEDERQAFLRRVQYVDPRERRA